MRVSTWPSSWRRRGAASRHNREARPCVAKLMKPTGGSIFARSHAACMGRACSLGFPLPTEHRHHRRDRRQAGRRTPAPSSVRTTCRLSPGFARANMSVPLSALKSSTFSRPSSPYRAPVSSAARTSERNSASAALSSRLHCGEREVAGPRPVHLGEGLYPPPLHIGRDLALGEGVIERGLKQAKRCGWPIPCGASDLGVVEIDGPGALAAAPVLVRMRRGALARSRCQLRSVSVVSLSTCLSPTRGGRSLQARLGVGV